MLGRTNTGGGGTFLNFKVVGNPQPASPKENTIWVNTDTPITGYAFSATEPADHMEGIVWISVGTSSHVAFSALKKHSVMVYPMSAKQHIGGAWVDKTAKSYQNGAWVDWMLNVISAIDEFVEIRESGTGGITVNDDISVTVTTTGTGNNNQGAVTYYSDNTFDLSQYKTLTFDLDNGTTEHIHVGFFSKRTSPYYWENVIATKQAENVGSHVVDLSNVNATGYFGIGLAGFRGPGASGGFGTQSATIANVRLL